MCIWLHTNARSRKPPATRVKKPADASRDPKRCGAVAARADARGASGWVFTWENREGQRDRVGHFRDSGWIQARRRAAGRYAQEFGKEASLGFQHVRAEARAAGPSFEDRHDLLGHRCKFNSVISRIPTSPCVWGRLDKSYARASLFLPNTDRIADCPVAYVTLIRRGRMVKSPTHSQFHEISGDSRPAARSSRAAALTPRLQAARGGWLVECQALCS